MHKNELWTCWRNFDVSMSFESFLGSFMASLCSSRWSDQKCCKTECVALKTSFQTIFNDFSRKNHGHGDHEHGVRRGVLGGKHSVKKMSAGGRLCTSQENPHFLVPTIKVRPPDGTCRYFLLFVRTFFMHALWGPSELQCHLFWNSVSRESWPNECLLFIKRKYLCDLGGDLCY